jgi:kynurenine formamidase
MTSMAKPLPTYAQLLERNDAPPGSSWGLFGDDDQVGTVNLLEDDVVKNAATLVRRGARFNLDYSLDEFRPPISPFRRRLEHKVNSRHDGQIHDDYLDDFFLQASSQIDGLRHHSHSIHGFYGGADRDDIKIGSPTLGIQHVSEAGIAGRGVLLDVHRYLKDQGRPIDLRVGHQITVADLDGAAQSQRLTFKCGDILLLHTGWSQFYLKELSFEEREEIVKKRHYCGLLQSRDTLAWLWDNHFSVVASDTVAVEARPVAKSSPLKDNVEGLMHPDLIALLGISLGELWKLDALAEDCARDGVYECFVTAKPLNLVGGVGSPANALAIK